MEESLEQVRQVTYVAYSIGLQHMSKLYNTIV